MFIHDSLDTEAIQYLLSTIYSFLRALGSLRTHRLLFQTGITRSSSLFPIWLFLDTLPQSKKRFQADGVNTAYLRINWADRLA